MFVLFSVETLMGSYWRLNMTEANS